VAARDEARRIGATLAALARAFPNASTWVADDGSRDATAQIAREAGARVVRCERRRGKGAAMTLAVREALREVEADSPGTGAGRAEPHASAATCGANLVLCDGDLGDSAVELAVLADAVARGQTDLAVAAFARREGGGFGLARAFARWAIRRRCGLDTSAPLSGQRALRAGVLADVLPFARGFGMEIGMTIDAVRAGHRVVEIELDLDHRVTGRTPAGFVHRARQFGDCARAYLTRG